MRDETRRSAEIIYETFKQKQNGQRIKQTM